MRICWQTIAMKFDERNVVIKLIPKVKANLNYLFTVLKIQNFQFGDVVSRSTALWFSKMLIRTKTYTEVKLKLGQIESNLKT